MLIGRALGALFGFILLSPVGLGIPGLIFGVLIGSFFDKGYRRVHHYYSPEEQHRIQHAYFKATFSVMGHVAKADGRVSEAEIRAASQLMKRMRLSTSQRQAAIRYFNQGKSPAFNLQACLTELINTCHHQPMLLRTFVEIQYQAAMIDGLESPAKRAVLEQVCARLGISPMFQGFRGPGVGGGSRRYQHTPGSKPFEANPLDQDYKLLEIPKSANAKIIKRAYRKLMSQHHPDKLIAQGLPEEMIKLTTEKTQQIQAAYDRIRKARGF